MESFKLNIFKDTYHSLRTNIPWLDHLLLGLLVALEGWYIHQKVESTVDEAISLYEAQEALTDNSPIYSESEDGEMRVRAPWIEE
jgi:hypothetical protein